VIPSWWRVLRFVNALSPGLADALAAPQLRAVRERIARAARP
jgi:hypothetical protein